MLQFKAIFYQKLCFPVNLVMSYRDTADMATRFLGNLLTFTFLLP